MNKKAILVGCAFSASSMAQDHFDAAVCMAQKDLAEREDCYAELKEADDSYKTWQPYLEYLALPEEYRSPEMERTYKEAFRAQRVVSGMTAKNAESVESFFAKLAAKPAVDDNGWNTYPEDNGVVLVERLVFISGRPIYYRWKVDKAGLAKPVNGHAMGITK